MGIMSIAQWIPKRRRRGDAIASSVLVEADLLGWDVVAEWELRRVPRVYHV